MTATDSLKNKNPLRFFEEDGHTDLAMKAFVASITLSYRYRSGWLRPGRDIPKKDCETVAEHIWGMICLDEVIMNRFPEYHSQFSPLKVLNLIKRHELPEIFGEDYHPGHKLSAEEKHKREQASLNEWLDLLKNPTPIFQDWLEYQKAETLESRYVHVLDYMQRAIRSRVYEKEFRKDLTEFYIERAKKIPEPLLSFFETLLDME